MALFINAAQLENHNFATLTLTKRDGYCWRTYFAPLEADFFEEFRRIFELNGQFLGGFYRLLEFANSIGTIL